MMTKLLGALVARNRKIRRGLLGVSRMESLLLPATRTAFWLMGLTLPDLGRRFAIDKELNLPRPLALMNCIPSAPW